MDIAQVDRLKEEQKKGLHLCEEKIAQWEKFKVDYETLKQRLETFSDALSYDITVPFGSQAFTKGKVVHTNEVMVLLGDNWFAEVSTKQATNIAERRMKQCVEMLDGLKKEKDQLNDWVKYIEEVSPKEELVEIMETYDEEQEKLWREQHAARVRSHRQQLARERQNSGGSNSEEDPLLRLDSFEESESQGKSGESEDGSSFFEECSDSEEQAREPLERLKLNYEVAKSFGEEERKRTVTESSESNECSSSLESAKHVRWQDLSRQNIKRITFKHTKNHVKNRHHHQSNNIPVEEETDGVDRLQSPSDIYRQFGAFFQSSPPKSILKVKHSPSSESEEPFFQQLPKETEENCSQKHAVIGEVRENSSPIHITQKKSRPASHFKNSRKNRKKW